MTSQKLIRKLNAAESNGSQWVFIASKSQKSAAKEMELADLVTLTRATLDGRVMLVTWNR